MIKKYNFQMKMLLESTFEILRSIDVDRIYEKKLMNRTFAIGQKTTRCTTSQRFLCFMCHSKSSVGHWSSSLCSWQTAATWADLSCISCENTSLKALSNSLPARVFVLLLLAATSSSSSQKGNGLIISILVIHVSQLRGYKVSTSSRGRCQPHYNGLIYFLKMEISTARDQVHSTLIHNICVSSWTY